MAAHNGSQSRPFLDSYQLYIAHGFRLVFPLPKGEKSPPPLHATGRKAQAPSGEQLEMWAATQADGNIGVRLPEGFVGLDVDDYDHKSGAKTLALLEMALGELPPTWTSSSRGPGDSGIRIYRCNAGLAWPGGGGDIDIIHPGLRYLTAWPSVHPQGMTYEWYNPEGSPSMQLPMSEAVPFIPVKWETGLKDAFKEIALGPANHEGANGGSRHSAMLANVWKLIDANHDEATTKRTLAEARRAFVIELGPDRTGGESEAASEFDRAVDGAVQKIRNGQTGISRPSASRSIHLATDLANAERFVSMSEKDLRYSGQMGWIAWNGKRWIAGAELLVQERAKEVVQAIRKEADEARSRGDSRGAEALHKHWKSSQSAARIRSTIELARSAPEVLIDAREFDTKQWRFNCVNGELDLKTSEIQPHSPDSYFMNLANVEFGPTASCPIFDKFLGDICGSDPELEAFLLRSIGLCLTGDVSEQYLWFLLGNGANGKSTLVSLISWMLGSFAVHLEPGLMTASKFEQHSTGLTDLKGARFAVAPEVEAGKPLAESTIKRLTGGDSITGRKMRRDNMTFDPTHKLWMSGNEKPPIMGTNNGIWRRVLVIPLEQTFDGDRRDPKLLDKLKGEAPGILNRFVEGCNDWQDEGLRVPDRVLNATRSYRTEQDQIGRFLQDCFELDSSAEIDAGSLRRVYKAWCETEGEDVKSAKFVAAGLRRHGLAPARGSHGVRYWRGLRCVRAQ